MSTVVNVTPERIKRDLLTQNNRITSHPIFVVQQRVRDYGFDPAYSDRIVWIDTANDHAEATPEEHERLEREYQEAGHEEPTGWTRTGYRDRYEFVTACLTEQGCKDYLAVNGHNLTDPRIYVYSGHRNYEWQAIREHYMREAPDG